MTAATHVPPGDVDQLETEWQFTSPELPAVEEWLRAHPSRQGVDIGEPDTRLLRDVYYDTEDHRIHRAGFTLRIRAVGDRNEATLKALAPASDGLRVRREITHPLTEDDPRDLFVSQSPVGMRLRRLCRVTELRPIAEIHTERRTFPLLAGGEPKGSLALDRSALTDASGRVHHLQRVEVEAAGTATDALVPFVEKFRQSERLAPAEESKVEWALRTLGLNTDWMLDLGPTKVEPTMSVGEVAFAVLRKQLGAFLRHEPGTRLGDDPEHLHDMRVAARRMRAALRVFEDVLPPNPTVRYLAGLHEVGQVLGRVRDLDVQIEQIRNRRRLLVAAGPSDLDPLLQRLSDKRELAREDMIATLSSAHYRRLVRSLTAWVRTGPGRRTAAAVPSRTAAPLLIRRARRRVMRTARRLEPSSPPTAYHELRIRCKRFRYTMEFLQPLYGAPAARLTEALVDVQDCLGLHQDVQVSIALMRRLAEDREAPLPEGTAVAVGELTQLCATQAEELRGQFPKLFSHVEGKRWRSLRGAMLAATEALAADLFRQAHLDAAQTQRARLSAPARNVEEASSPSPDPCELKPVAPVEDPEHPWNS